MKKKVKTSTKQLLKKTPTSPRVARKAAKASKGSPKPKKADTGECRAKGAKRASGLDAAAKVLADVGKPMSCKAIVDRMIAEGLWPIRRWGKPDDVARAVAAIASDQFPFSTGDTFNVDGGFHIRTL